MSIRIGNKIVAGSGGGTGGGIANVDNATIITNADGSISTIAIKDQNNTENVKFWTGTLAEYEALEEYDDNILYNITDDDESVEGLGQEIEELMAKFKPATMQEIGLVKPDGTTITITEDGTISADIPEIDTSKLATKEELNAKQDAGDYALKSDIPDVSNLASKDEIPAPYELPIASTDVLGGVKVDGNTIKIVSGIISAVASGDSAWTVTHNQAENDESYVIANKDSNFKIQCGTFHIPYYAPSNGTQYHVYTLPSQYSTFCMVYHKTNCILSGAPITGEGFAKETTTTTFTTEKLNLYSKVTVNWFAVGY